MNAITFAVTWGGVGLIKKAPGTWGSLAALPFAYAIHMLYGSLALQVAAMAVLIIGTILSDIYMNQQKTKHDPKEIVIDEVAGMWLLAAFFPPTLLGYTVAFVVFRVFDIRKYWPIEWLDEHISGGLGVMIDDIAAAVYPLLLLMFSVLVINYGGVPMTLNRLLSLLQ
jgi:phosphatidylglycerophosphatase A